MRQELSPLVIIGYGSQAKAWALNLRDSGYRILLALRRGSPRRTIGSKQGFEILNLESDDLKKYSHFIMLTPDHTHLQILQRNISYLKKNSRLIFAHGFSFIAEDLQKQFPQFEYLLLAPKAIASELRFRYETKDKLGAVYSAKTKTSKNFIKKLSKDLGITGLYSSSFLEETRADLFSEQSLLCSMLPYGALHSYNHLRKKGIEKELAFMECWLEVKLMADVMVERGPEEFFNLISDNALLGSERGRRLIFDQKMDDHYKELQETIWNGRFIQDSKSINFKQLRQQVLNFWKDQELSQTYNFLKKNVID